MDLVLANTIQGLGHYIREFPPDLIVVHGDRLEALAGAAVGALNNTLVAHVEGESCPGRWTSFAARRVKLSHALRGQRGGPHAAGPDGRASPERVRRGLARHRRHARGRLPDLDEVRRKYEIPFRTTSSSCTTPSPRSLERLGRHIEEVAAALRARAAPCVAIYPNNDAGSEIILERLRALASSEPERVRLIPSMRFEYFLRLLKGASAIVGNSSAGVREAPVYGVPTVNVGTRQLNRFKGGASVLDVPEDRAAIRRALENLPRDCAPS
jgi:UDP-N-acetylglucosamine 2-epimerase (hydrolysing)